MSLVSYGIDHQIAIIVVGQNTDLYDLQATLQTAASGTAAAAAAANGKAADGAASASLAPLPAHMSAQLARAAEQLLRSAMPSGVDARAVVSNALHLLRGTVEETTGSAGATVVSNALHLLRGTVEETTGSNALHLLRGTVEETTGSAGATTRATTRGPVRTDEGDRAGPLPLRALLTTTDAAEVELLIARRNYVLRALREIYGRRGAAAFWRIFLDPARWESLGGMVEWAGVRVCEAVTGVGVRPLPEVARDANGRVVYVDMASAAAAELSRLREVVARFVPTRERLDLLKTTGRSQRILHEICERRGSMAIGQVRR